MVWLLLDLRLRNPRVRLGRDERPPPAVDERLVAPESRFEAVDGVLIETMGANEPHATANGELVFVLRAREHVDGAAKAALRDGADRYSDVAPYASIFPVERAQEGGRKLEHLVFEVRDTQPLVDVTRKAQLLAARGVRRIFCLEVQAGRILEWASNAWSELPGEGVIQDSILAAPLPVRALVNAAEADNTAARALMAKGNPVIEQALVQRHEEGRSEGLAPFVHLLQQRLARTLTAAEDEELRLRLRHLGGSRLAAVVNLTPQAIEAWLADRHSK